MTGKHFAQYIVSFGFIDNRSEGSEGFFSRNEEPLHGQAPKVHQNLFNKEEIVPGVYPFSSIAW